MSFTYKPKRKKRRQTHGFRTRQKTRGGRNTVARRRRKGRSRLAAR